MITPLTLIRFGKGVARNYYKFLLALLIWIKSYAGGH